jgi:tetratricopeptide (TPR) repeat protein
VRVWYALYLSVLNRSDEAIREIMRARELDPMSLVVNTEVGRVLELAHRDSDAEAAYERVIEIDSTYAMANNLLTMLHYRTHHFTAAEVDVRRWLGSSMPLDLRSYAQAVRGQRGEALRTLNELRRQSTTRFVSPYTMAVTYAALGDTTNALAWLDRAYTTHASAMAAVAVDPLMDGVRGSGGFTILLHRLGLR